MKIGRKIYFALYVAEIKVKIKEAEQDSIFFKTSLKISKTFIENYKEYIQKETTVDYNDLLKNPSLSITGSLRERFFTVNKELLTKDAFLFYLKNYSKNLKKYNNHKDYIKSLNSQLVSYKAYSLVIKKFNLKISKEIIERQYIFKLGYKLGNLLILRNISSKPSINWFASNKIKKQLLDSNKIPFKKEDQLQAEKEGRVYEGVEWLIKHDKEQPFLNYVRDSFFHFEMIKSKAQNSIFFFLNEFKKNKSYNIKSYPLNTEYNEL